MSTLSSIAEEMQEKVLNVNVCFKETETIKERVGINSATHFSRELEDMKVELSTWGRYITLSGISSKELFNEMVITLTELYGDGTKEAYDSDVRYQFVKSGKWYSDRIFITLQVGVSITGCKLIIEEIMVEEKIIPAHIEEKIRVKCD